jgi:hypothetical protein
MIKLEIQLPQGYDGYVWNQYREDRFMLYRCSSGPFVHSKKPTDHMVTEDLFVYFWDQIPEEFIEPLVYRELQVADSVYSHGKPLAQATADTIDDASHYAKEHLEPKTLEGFIKWMNR